MKLSVAACTESRDSKLPNEDSIFARSLWSDGALLIVADGAGEKIEDKIVGKISSQLTTDVTCESLQDLIDEKTATVAVSDLPDLETYLEERLKEAIETANEAIYNHLRQLKLGGSGISTVACVLVYGKLAVVANVGDCRVYHLHGEQLEQVTDDHVIIEYPDLVPPEIAFAHSRRVLVRALGFRPDVRIDILTRVLEVGDQLLLCSPGLYRVLNEPELRKCLLSTDDPEVAIKNLVQAARGAGIVDDTSVIVGKIRDIVSSNR